MEIRPAKETPRPVSFPRFVVFDEFIEVDGPVGGIQGIGARTSSIIGQSRRDGDASTRKEDGPIILGVWIAQCSRCWRGEKFDKCCCCSSDRVGATWDDQR